MKTISYKDRCCKIVTILCVGGMQKTPIFQTPSVNLLPRLPSKLARLLPRASGPVRAPGSLDRSLGVDGLLPVCLGIPPALVTGVLAGLGLMTAMPSGASAKSLAFEGPGTSAVEATGVPGREPSPP